VTQGNSDSAEDGTEPSAIRIQRTALFCCDAVVLLGGLVLSGWILDIGTLKSVVPGLVAMKVNTAVGFILVGFAVRLRVSHPAGARATTTSSLLALAAGSLGLLTLMQDVTGLRFGIDELLFADPTGWIGASPPGRMAPPTAIAFASLGLALLLLPHPQGFRLGEILAVAAALIGLLGVIGYSFQARELYGLAAYYVPMALPTALGFVIAAPAVLLTRPERGLVSVVTSRDLGGSTARRLLPAVIGLPIVLGGIKLLALRLGMVHQAFGMSAHAVATVVVLGTLTLWIANQLNQTDRRRRAAEEAQRRSQRELLEQSALLRSILDSVPNGVVVSNAEGKLLAFNPAAQEISGRAPMDPSSEQSIEYHGAFLPDGVTPFPLDAQPMALALEGISVDDVEMVLRNEKLGRMVHIRISGRPIRDPSGAIFAGVVAFSDITAFRQAEEKIRELNASLDRRVAELQVANKELEAFSYSVSHDLRAPLRAIDGFSHALLEDYTDRLDDSGKDYLQRVRGATQRMAQLIDALLSLSRIARAQMRFASVDLSSIAREIAADLQANDPSRNVTFHIETPVTASGDPQLLRIVLDNLFRNAWKFTAKNPTAAIEFGITQQDGVTVYFVRDDGVGFDMNHASKLFGAFQRLHGRGEFEGTGIGLATVARIIHRHGGQIWADAAPERGAAFSFTLAHEKNTEASDGYEENPAGRG
jgi:signal transduction histidine kinase